MQKVIVSHHSNARALVKIAIGRIHLWILKYGDKSFKEKVDIVIASKYGFQNTYYLLREKG